MGYTYRTTGRLEAAAELLPEEQVEPILLELGRLLKHGPRSPRNEAKRTNRAVRIAERRDTQQFGLHLTMVCFARASFQHHRITEGTSLPLGDFSEWGSGVVMDSGRLLNNVTTQPVKGESLSVAAIAEVTATRRMLGGTAEIGARLTSNDGNVADALRCLETMVAEAIYASEAVALARIAANN